MKKTINVTQRDIDMANKAQKKMGYTPSHQCPIYRAAHRVIPLTNLVGINALCRSNKTNIRLPEVAIRFIHEFDTANEVKPFKFTVEVPDDAHS